MEPVDSRSEAETVNLPAGHYKAFQTPTATTTEAKNLTEIPSVFFNVIKRRRILHFMFIKKFRCFRCFVEKMKSKNFRRIITIIVLFINTLYGIIIHSTKGN